MKQLSIFEQAKTCENDKKEIKTEMETSLVRKEVAKEVLQKIEKSLNDKIDKAYRQLDVDYRFGLETALSMVELLAEEYGVELE